MKNKRQKERVTARVIVKTINGDSSFYNQSGDISATGIYILSPESYKIGEILNFEFTLPQTSVVIKCWAEVVRTKKEGGYTGVHAKFTELSDEDRKKIEMAMDHLVIDAWYFDEDKEEEPLKPEKNVSLSASQRKKTRIPVKMWIRDINLKGSEFVPTRDVSATGMYIHSPVVHDTGSVIVIEFHIAEANKTITTEALIVFSEKVGDFYGLGLKFIKLNNKDRVMLEKAMDTVITKQWFINQDV